MSAGGGSEKWPKFVHFCPTVLLHTSLALTPCLHDQWGFACSYALGRRASRTTRSQGGSIPPSVYEPSVGGMIASRGWGKVQKWETNGLINAACGNQCSFRGCELGEWLVIVVLWLQVGWRNWGHSIHLKHQSKFKWRHAEVKISNPFLKAENMRRHLKTQDRQILDIFQIPRQLTR